jgi:hypothetical protein
MSLGERLDARSKRSLVLVAVAVVAVFVTGIAGVVHVVIDIAHLVEPGADWRQAEYRRLNGLKAGYTIAKFEEVLGTPLFSRPAGRGLTENTFQGRDYWVQAISDARGTVTIYAVTSCRRDFNPRFVIPLSGKQAASVTLSRTVSARVLPERYQGGVIADYQGPGATSDIYYYDTWYGANPGFYKGFAWGVNDACPGWHREYFALEGRHLFPDYSLRSFHGYVLRGGPSVARFRASVPVNTYAETAPLVPTFTLRPTPHMVAFPPLRPPLHLGADRILIRGVVGE